MKIKVTLKDPDALYHAFDKLGLDTDTPESEGDIAYGVITDNWMKYGEYLTVEFDLENKTATVLKTN